MNLKKPKFWDYERPNLIAYLLLPISILVRILSAFIKIQRTKKFKIKTICVGNIYIGGTGKTSLAIKINELLTKKILNHVLLKNIIKIKLMNKSY